MFMYFAVCLHFSKKQIIALLAMILKFGWNDYFECLMKVNTSLKVKCLKVHTSLTLEKEKENVNF